MSFFIFFCNFYFWEPSGYESVEMTAPYSPLHVLDSQLWEHLLPYIKKKGLHRLILAGDKKTLSGCFRSIKSLQMSYKTRNCVLLSLAVQFNLRSLSIVSSQGVPKQNLARTVPMIAGSNLIKLELNSVDCGDLHLTLPATVKNVVIICVSQKALQSFVTLGEAKLSHLHLEHKSLGYRTSYIASFVNNLVTPSAETLECLTFLFPVIVPLNLSNHLLLSNLSLQNYHLRMPFIVAPPPAAKGLVLMSMSCTASDIKNTISTFGCSLTMVKIDVPHITSETLNIAGFGNIEVLEFTHDQRPMIITCAPNHQLRIICACQPTHVYNNGPGSVLIESKKLVLFGGVPPSLFVLNHLDWSGVQSIDLDYLDLNASQDDQIAQNVDYGFLRQAVNVRSLYIKNDSLQSFAARDGPRFLQIFCKLATLNWQMDFEVCLNLTCSGFVLPTTVMRLRLEALTTAATSDNELIHLLDWVRHTPRHLSFVNLPLVPKMIVVCNDATSPLRFDFISTCGIQICNIWTHAPVFAPSTHVSHATFNIFDYPTEIKTKVVQNVFGSHYDTPLPNNDRYTIILYTKHD